MDALRSMSTGIELWKGSRSGSDSVFSKASTYGMAVGVSVQSQGTNSQIYRDTKYEISTPFIPFSKHSPKLIPPTRQPASQSNSKPTVFISLAHHIAHTTEPQDTHLTPGRPLAPAGTAFSNSAHEMASWLVSPPTPKRPYHIEKYISAFLFNLYAATVPGQRCNEQSLLGASYK